MHWTSQDRKIAQNLQGITFADNQFLLVSDYNTILTSNDGINGQPQSSGCDCSLMDVAFGDNKYVAFSSDFANSNILSSSDGVNWTKDANKMKILYRIKAMP